MATHVWPAGLPQNVAPDGYTEEPPDNMLRTKPSVGPVKTRRRTTSSPRKFTITLGKITAAQTAILDYFYYTTCSEGIDQISWVHPRTKEAATLHWGDKPPMYSTAGETHFEVTLKVEIRP